MLSETTALTACGQDKKSIVVNELSLHSSGVIDRQSFIEFAHNLLIGAYI